MATVRPKEKTAVGKEKVLPLSSKSTTNTKKTTKPCTPSDKPTSASQKEKQIPNYLKPTISSRLESHSFKNSKTDSPQRTVIDRRRSLDRSPSSSHITKHNQSSSRLHKALVSPGPRERSAAQNRSLSLSSKSALEKTSRTSRDGKLFTSTKSVNKSRKSPSPTPKKVARDGSATVSSTKAPKSDDEAKEEIKYVETEAEVKDASDERVEEAVMENDNKQEESENAADPINLPAVDPENEHEHMKEHEQDQSVKETKPGEPQTQADNGNNVSPTASEEQQQAAEEARTVSLAEEIKQVAEVEEAEKQHPPEEKAEDAHQEDGNKSPDESIDHQEPEEQKDDVEEKQEENDNGVTEEMGSGNEEEAKDKEAVEETDDMEKREVKEKAELTPKQEGAGEQGKKEMSQVSNDVIEETAIKLEKSTNKVRALAGAFQTVIDHQSK